MNNKAVTPYSLNLQGVLNEFNKYAIKLSKAPELGVSHTQSESKTQLNMQGVHLSQDLKALVLTPEFNKFINQLDHGILQGEVVLARPHSVSIVQTTYKTAYELASMALMFRNYCYMKKSEFSAQTANWKTYSFLSNLATKIHNTAVKIMGYLLGSTAPIMSHFINSMSHELDSRGAQDGQRN